MNMKINAIIFKAASEAFLTKVIPDNWEDMAEEEQNAFLEEHKWSVLDNHRSDEVYDLIDEHAQTIKKAFKDILKITKDKMIDAAIDGSLPSDMNELDLQYMLNMTE